MKLHHVRASAFLIVCAGSDGSVIDSRYDYSNVVAPAGVR
jgi:hypothetical protein